MINENKLDLSLNEQGFLNPSDMTYVPRTYKFTAEQEKKLRQLAGSVSRSTAKALKLSAKYFGGPDFFYDVILLALNMGMGAASIVLGFSTAPPEEAQKEADIAFTVAYAITSIAAMVLTYAYSYHGKEKAQEIKDVFTDTMAQWTFNTWLQNWSLGAILQGLNIEEIPGAAGTATFIAIAFVSSLFSWDNPPLREALEKIDGYKKLRDKIPQKLRDGLSALLATFRGAANTSACVSAIPPQMISLNLLNFFNATTITLGGGGMALVTAVPKIKDILLEWFKGTAFAYYPGKAAIYTASFFPQLRKNDIESSRKNEKKQEELEGLDMTDVYYLLTMLAAAVPFMPEDDSLKLIMAAILVIQLIAYNMFRVKNDSAKELKETDGVSSNQLQERMSSYSPIATTPSEIQEDGEEFTEKSPLIQSIN